MLIDTPAVWYEGVPTSDKGWKNITDYRQNDEKFTDLATKKSNCDLLKTDKGRKF